MPDDIVDQFFAKHKAAASNDSGVDYSVPKVLDDEFSKLGYNDTGREALLGNVGRENSFNRKTIFAGHQDPANGANNLGIISWQGDRRNALIDNLKSQGVYGQGNDDELRGMARYLDTELQTKYPKLYDQVKNAPDIRTASKALRNYINYVPGAPYNTPDSEYDTLANRQWAQRVKQAGYATGPGQSFQDIASDILGSGSTATKPGHVPRVPASPTFPGQARPPLAPAAQPPLTTSEPTPPQGAAPEQPQAQTGVAPVQPPPQQPAAAGTILREKTPLEVIQTGNGPQPDVVPASGEYNDWLKLSGYTVDTPQHRDEYAALMKSTSEIADQQTQADLAASQQEQPAAPQPQASAQPVHRADGSEYATVQWMAGGNAKTQALDDAASQLSARLGTDYDLTREYLDKRPFAEGDLTQDLAERQRKAGTEFQIGLDANAVNELKAKDADQKQKKAASDVIANDPTNPGRDPVAKRIYADWQAGLSDPDKAEAALHKENSAYDDWLGQTGYTNDDYLSSHKQAFQEDRDRVLQTFGSFSALKSKMDEAKKYYADKPWTVLYDQLLNSGGDADFERARLGKRLYKPLGLTDQQYQESKAFGGALKARGSSGPAAAALKEASNTIDYIQGLGDFVGLNNSTSIGRMLGIPTDKLDQLSAQAQVAGSEASPDTTVGQIAEGVTAAGLAAPRYIVSTTLAGGNPIIGFGLAEAPIAMHRGDVFDAIRTGSHSAALSLFLGGTSRFANWVGAKAAQKFITPEVLDAINNPEPTAQDALLSKWKDRAVKLNTLASDSGATEGEKTAAETQLTRLLDKAGMTYDDLVSGTAAKNPAVEAAVRKGIVARAIADTGTRVGAVTVGGYTMAKAEGQDNREAIKQGLLFAVMELTGAYMHGEKFRDLSDLDQTVVRVPDPENPGKSKDVLLLANDKGGLDVSEVKVPDETVQAEILPKDRSPSVSLDEMQRKLADRRAQKGAETPEPVGVKATNFSPQFTQKLRDAGATDAEIEAMTPQTAMSYLDKANGLLPEENTEPQTFDDVKNEVLNTTNEKPIQQTAKVSQPAASVESPPVVQPGEVSASAPEVSGKDVYKEATNLPNPAESDARDQLDAANVKDKTFTKQDVPIQELVDRDADLQQFIKEQPAKPGRKVEAPIVIGQVTRGGPEHTGIVDGYHRIAQAIANGDKTIPAYVEKAPITVQGIQLKDRGKPEVPAEPENPPVEKPANVLKVGDRIPWKNSSDPNEKVRDIEVVKLTPKIATIRWVGGQETQRLPREAVEQRLAEQQQPAENPPVEKPVENVEQSTNPNSLKEGDIFEWNGNRVRAENIERDDKGNVLHVTGPKLASKGKARLGKMSIGNRPTDTVKLSDRDFKITEPAERALDTRRELPNSLGIPRAAMPQIGREHMDSFIKFAKDQGVDVRDEKIKISDLKPTQNEYNPAQAASLPPEALKKPLMVSADDRILDGHNTFVRLSEENPNQTVDIHRIPLRTEEALALMRDFPKAGYKPVEHVGTAAELEAEQKKEGLRDADEEASIVNPINLNYSQAKKVSALVKLSRKNAPLIQKIVDRIKNELGLDANLSFKKPETILDKANRPEVKVKKPWFNVEHVRDALRFKAKLDNFDNAVQIAKIFKEEGLEVVKLDTGKMMEPLKWGWRFVGFDLRMPNGQLVEFYSTLKELEAPEVKDTNHDLFEKWRQKTSDEIAARYQQYEKDREESFNRYLAAFEAGLARLGLDESAARASWAKVSASLQSITGPKDSMSSTAVGTRRDQVPSRSLRKPTDLPAESVSTQSSPVSGSRDTEGFLHGVHIINTPSENNVTREPGSQQEENVATSANEAYNPGEEQDNGTGTPTASNRPGEPIAARTPDKGSRGSGRSDVLGEVLPEVSKEPGTGSGRSGVAATESVPGEVPATDRSGNGPTDVAPNGNAGNDISAGSGSRSGVDKQPAADTGSAEQPAKPAKRVIGTDGNYYVNDVESFAAGGLKTKFKANVDAINTLRQIQAEGRSIATPEEQAKLAKYIGWGQFPALFNTYNEKAAEWEKERKELLGLISKEEFESASASTKNAHYTSPMVVKTVWDAVKKLGFKGGNAVETSLGVGNFLYLMPQELRGQTRVTGIELDLLTAQIAKLLFPNYDIRQMGYQEFQPPKGFYDLAISNVPFGSYMVNDPAMPHFLKNKIHNYFFAKSLENVRPGGLIAFITSTGTMSTPDVLEHLKGHADLVAAMRFPAKTFEKEAGTAVVTDLVILRVRNPNAARLLNEDKTRYEGLVTDDDKIIEDYEKELKAIDKKTDPEAYEAIQLRKANVELHRAEQQQNLNKALDGLKEDQRFRKSDWTTMGTVPDPDGGDPIPLNQYYIDHPEMLLGKLDRKGTMYRGNSVNLSRTPDFEEKLAAAMAKIPKDAMIDRESTAAEAPKLEAAPEAMRQGQLIVKDGKAFTREGSYLKELPMKKADVAKVEQLLTIRDALNKTTDFERQNDLVAAEEARKELNKSYDDFVKQHGDIHSNKKLIVEDPDHWRLLALENVDKDRKVTGKADIFTLPTVSAIQHADTADSISDAIGIVLNQSGTIDIPEIARLTQSTPEQVATDLVDQGLAFKDPRDGWTAKDVYLSGETRRKLREAQEAAKLDKEYEPNVQALEKVQPEDLPYRRITATLGAAWIPETDVKQFMVDMMKEAGEHGIDDDALTVRRLATGDWIVGFKNKNLARSAASTSVLGTEERNFAQIIDAAIRDMPIQIYKTEGKDRVFQAKASARANRKVKDVRNKFKRWIWQDDERRERLHRAFNDNFNDEVKTHWDGSHLTFPGMSTLWRDRLFPHVPDAVYRLITQGRLLGAHEVGTGKTAIIVVGAMESRRLKLAKKPMIVALNANVNQIVDTAHELYPAARILAAHESMDANRRKETTTRIATGDWDMVILTHDNLGLIPMSKARQVAFIEEELQILRDQVKAAQAEGEEPQNDYAYGRKKKSKNEDNRVVKALEAKIATRKAKLDELFAKPKDDAMTFEELGVDMLLVDEAHAFKNLDIYTTRQGTKGIPSSNAQRATHLFMVSRYLADINNGRGVSFFTGTPISNTTAESFNMMRYLMYKDLKARGIDLFDSWAANYGENLTAAEMDATGQLKQVTRFQKFKNLETLSSLLGKVMDVKYADELPGFKRPKRVDQIHTTPMSDHQKAYQFSLVERAEALKHMTRDERKQKGADNWLAIGTDARKMAIDMRLLDPNAEDHPDSKVNKLVENALDIWKKNPDKVQLIFSDVGVNPTKDSPNFRLYGDIIDKLVKGGVPRSKIIDFSKFGSGGKKPKALAEGEEDEGESPEKSVAMDRLNSGDALFAIGSAAKLGTGVNVQKLVIAMHKLDVKIRPDLDEQEIGRGHRNGNINPIVYLHRYTTQDTFDMFYYDRLKQKKAFIDDLLRGEAKGEFIDSIDEALDYDTVVAYTASNPLIRDRIEVMRELRGLEDDYEGYQEDQLRLRDRKARAKSEIGYREGHIADVESDRKDALDKEGNNTVTVGPRSFEIENDKELKEIDRQVETIRKDIADSVGQVERGTEGSTSIGDFTFKDKKALAEFQARLDKAGKEFPTPVYVAANQAIKDEVDIYLDKLEKTVSSHSYSGADWEYYSKIMNRGDGRVEIGKMFGFPLYAKFERVESKMSDGSRQTHMSWKLQWEWSRGIREAPQTTLGARNEIRQAVAASTKFDESQIAQKQQDIANIDKSLSEEKFEDQARLEELRKKLNRINIELGAADVMPEGYKNIEDSAKEQEEPDPENFSYGTINQGRFVQSDARVIIVGDDVLPTVEDRLQDYSSSNTQHFIDRAEQFLKKEGNNPKAVVTPFAVESDADTVLFDNGYGAPAKYFFPLYNAYPTADFLADGQTVYAVQDGDIAGVLLTNQVKGGIPEDLQPAMNIARYKAAIAADNRAYKAAEVLAQTKAAKADIDKVVADRRAGNPQFEGQEVEPFTLKSAIAPAGPTDSPAFKKWFGDSKVVGQSGKPLKVYHATEKGDIESFYPASHFGTQRQVRDILARFGVNWTETPVVGQTVYPAYLSIQNPKRVMDAGDTEGWETEIEKAKAEGHDGLVYLNRSEGIGNNSRAPYDIFEASDAKFRKAFPDAQDSWLAFEPTQIKSVFNQGTFDPNEPDTLKSVAKGDQVNITPENAHEYVDYLRGGGKMSPRSLQELQAALKARWEKETDEAFAGFTRGVAPDPQEFKAAQKIAKAASDRWLDDSGFVGQQPNAYGLEGDPNAPTAYHFTAPDSVLDILEENHLAGDMGETSGLSTTTNPYFDHPDHTQVRYYGEGNKPNTFADLGVRIDLDLVKLKDAGVRISVGSDDHGTFVGEEELRIGKYSGVPNAADYIKQIQVDRKIVGDDQFKEIEKAAAARDIPVVEKTDYEPPPPDTLKKTLDEQAATPEEKMTVAEMQQLPHEDFDNLLNKADIQLTGNKIKANAQSHEIYRRAFEEQRIRAHKAEPGNPDYEDLFGGIFLKPDSVKRTIDILKGKATEAARKGYSPEEIDTLNNHATMLADAAKAGKGAAIIYVLDNALPGEVFHDADYQGAIEKSLLDRHAPEFAAKLDAHPVTLALWKNHYKNFNEYKRIRSGPMKAAVLRAEIPTLLMDMSEPELAEYGITPEQRADYMLTWFKGYAAKNGVDALKTFEQEQLNVEEYLQAAAAATNAEPRPETATTTGSGQSSGPGKEPGNASSLSGQAGNGEHPGPNSPDGPNDQENHRIDLDDGKSVTGIRNSVVDEERAKRGLPPAMEAAHRAWGKVWEEAIAEIDNHPSAADDLIDELKDHPRPVTDKEDALLMHRQISLQNEHDRVLAELNAAKGDPLKLASIAAREAGLADALNEAYEISQQVGTLNAQGLAARAMLAKEDFSLSRMMLRKVAALGGRALTDAEREELTTLQKKISETQKAFDDYISQSDERIAELNAQRAIQAIVSPHILNIAEKLVNKLDENAAKARERLKGRGVIMAAGLDPRDLRDFAIIGASHLAHAGLDFGSWSAKMVADFGELVRPHLQKIYDSAQKVVANANVPKERQPTEKQTPIQKIERKIKAGKAQDITANVHDLAKEFVGQGIVGRDELIDAVHDALVKLDPTITRRDAMDAISGYGRFKQLSQEQVDVTLRDLKGQMQQIGKLEDMAAGQAPSKTGMERRAPSDEERRLIKQVEEAKRKGGYKITDPATQLRGALQAVKTRLENQIKDLQHQIDTRQKIVKTRTKLQYDPEAVKLRDQRNELRDQYYAMFGKPGLTDEQRLSQWKTRTENRAKELEQRIADGNFAPKPKRAPVQLDEAGLELQAKAQKLKDDYQRALIKDRLARRGFGEKLADGIVEYSRAAVLSSPAVFLKLFTAAFYRAGFTPLEEAVGSLYSAALPGIAKRAPRHGGINAKAEAKALVAIAVPGVKNAIQSLRTGNSQLDTLYGKEKFGTHVIPLLPYIGQSHGAMKAPIKTSEWVRSYEKRQAHAIANGIDVTDPLVTMRLGHEAYQDALRAVFQQNNFATDAYKMAMMRIEHSLKKTGKPTLLGKVVATGLRAGPLRIVKVPTNIVGEAVEYATGLFTGSIRAGRAFRMGVDTLDPEEADLIMRHLKKGSLGMALMLLGYFAAAAIGGYYQPGEKRKADDVPAGSIRLFGHDIPGWLLHNPLLEVLQVGATIRRVQDSYLPGKDKDGNKVKAGLGNGVIAAGLGLIDETPFVNEMLEFDKLRDPAKRDEFADSTVRDILIPQLSQWGARRLDLNQDGQITKRKPEDFVQNIESGIPGLRKNVPEKQPTKNMSLDDLETLYKTAGPENREEIRRQMNTKMRTGEDRDTLKQPQRNRLEELGAEIPGDVPIPDDVKSAIQQSGFKTLPDVGDKLTIDKEIGRQKLSPEQYSKYRSAALQEMYSAVHDLASADDWDANDLPTRKHLITKALAKARAKALKQFKADLPDNE